MNRSNKHMVALIRLALVVVVGLTMAGGTGAFPAFLIGQVEAQTGSPDPRIDYIQLNGSSANSVTITYPQSVDIKVQATNLGTGDGCRAAIYASFPGFDSSSDVNLVGLVSSSDDLEYIEFQPGVDSIYYDCGSGYVGLAKELLVCGLDASPYWEPGEKNHLEVSVRPPGPGTYQVYIKVAMSDGEGHYDFDPISGSCTDQQCQPVYLRTINVLASPYATYLPVVQRDYAPPLLVSGVQGVRVQASGCSSVSRCNSRLDCLQAAGANVLYYTVHYGELFYHSDLLSHRSFDSLEYLVPRAHDRGMKVYALIPVATIGWSEHARWNARFNYREVTEDWLDFTIPEARSFVADMAEEIVTNYDVDGILLDYIRWSGKWAHNAGLTAEPISLTVHGVSERVKAVRPEVVVAASTIADIDYARGYCGQDWVGWIDDQYVDYVTPMAYAESASQLRRWLREWDATGNLPSYVIPRLSTAWFDPVQAKSVEDVLAFIDICYDEGATGMTLWDDRYICGNPDLVKALGAGGW
jgi:hypothetical protein